MYRKTPLGDMLLVIRHERKITAKSMAETLDISATFLEFVERGDRRLPDELFHKILDIYADTPEVRQDLMMAYAKTYGKLMLFCDGSIPLSDLSALAKRMAEDETFPFSQNRQ